MVLRYVVRFTNKNHPSMWLVCKTRAKIILSDPETQETSLTTPRLLPLRRSRRSYIGKLPIAQSARSSRNILKRLGRSGRSGRLYGNQAFKKKRLPAKPFSLEYRHWLSYLELAKLCLYVYKRGGFINLLISRSNNESRRTYGFLWSLNFFSGFLQTARIVPEW